MKVIIFLLAALVASAQDHYHIPKISVNFESGVVSWYYARHDESHRGQERFYSIDPRHNKMGDLDLVEEEAAGLLASEKKHRNSLQPLARLCDAHEVLHYDLYLSRQDDELIVSQHDGDPKSILVNALEKTVSCGAGRVMEIPDDLFQRYVRDATSLLDYVLVATEWYRAKILRL